MTFDEVLDFAAAEMAKAFDGKRYKLENAAKNGAAKAYREGCIHAWTIARRVAAMNNAEIQAAFGAQSHADTFAAYDYDDAENALQEYDEKPEQDERLSYHVGDEVLHVDTNSIGVITLIDGCYTCVLFANGKTLWLTDPRENILKKTGRKYGDLQNMLAAMDEKQEEAHYADYE